MNSISSNPHGNKRVRSDKKLVGYCGVLKNRLLLQKCSNIDGEL